MVAGSIDGEHVSPIAPARLWKAGIRDAHILVPKIMGNVIQSIEILEGDGGAGTIKKFTFTEAADFKYMKDRVDVMDDEKFVFKYTVLEGGSIGTKLISSCFEVKFEAAAENGTLCKVHIELETIGDLPVDAVSNELKVGFFGLIKAVEAHLIANPDAYA